MAGHAETSLKKLFSLKKAEGESPYVRTPPAPPMPTETNPSSVQVFVLMPNEAIPWSRVAPKPADRTGETVLYKDGLEMVRYYYVRGDQWVAEYSEVRKGRWVKVVTVTTTLSWSYGAWTNKVVVSPPVMVPDRGTKSSRGRH